MTDSEFVHRVRDITGLCDASPETLLRVLQREQYMLFDAVCRDHRVNPQIGPLPKGTGCH